MSFTAGIKGRIPFLILLGIILALPCQAGYQCIDCSEDSLQVLWKSVRTPEDSLSMLVVAVDNGDPGGSIYNFPEKEYREIDQLIALNRRLHLVDDSPYKLLRDGISLWESHKQNEAIETFKKCIGLFDQQKKIQGDLSLLNKLRSYYSNSGQSEERLAYYQEKMRQYREHGPVENTAVCYHALAGYFLNHRNDYNLAINNYLKSAEVFQSFSISGYTNEITIIGLAYFMWGNYERAKHYLELAMPLIEKTKRWNLAIISKNLLAEIDENKKDFHGALSYIEESMKIADTIEVKTFLAITLALKGNCLLNLGRLDEAYQCLLNSIAIKDSFDIKPNSAEGFFEGEYFLYKYFLLKKNFNSAERYLLEALRESESNKANLLIQKYRQELITFYSSRGKYKKSSHYSMLFIQLQDSLRKSENEFNIASYENEKLEREKEIEVLTLNQDKELQRTELNRQKIIRNFLMAGIVVVILFAGIFFRQRNKINNEKKRSESLLLNILPAEVAEELKAKGHADAKQFDSVTVMFTDFKDFTLISENLSPSELVKEIDACFKAFDEITSKHNIEKIKTIGDSYMCAGGLPVANATHAANVVSAAMEIQAFMNARYASSPQGKFGAARIGIHTGPVVAGIVGVKKFAYDIWGDTVNIASRMESSGEPGKVNISGSTYEQVKDSFSCVYRGKIKAKNKGEIDMYFVDAGTIA